MYINTGYLKSQMKLRNPDIVNHHDNIGSILKHHRLKRNLTLEDSAEGICSISYLSKIENSLIRPSPKYLLQLEERYQANFQFENTHHTEILQQLIENIFYQHAEFMDEETFEEENYQTKLNHLGYFVSHHNYLRAKEKHNELNPYIKNLNDLELAFYIYLTAIILVQEGRLYEAFTLLYFPKVDIKNIYLNTLIDIQKICLATRMHHHPYISLNYESLLTNLIENEFYDQVHQIKFFYLQYLMDYIPENKLENYLTKSKHINKEQLQYLKAKYLYQQMQYEAAYDMINELVSIDFKSYILGLMILNKLKAKKIINKLLLMHFESYDDHYQTFINYLKIKYSNGQNVESQIEFIRSQVLKYRDLPDEVMYLNFWYEEGYQYFKDIGYYKDATTLMHLIYRKIKDLSTLFD